MDGFYPVGRRSSIAAVIVSRDRYDDLEKTVLAVLGQSVGVDVSIFIIDSSEDDKIIQKRFSEYDNVSVIRSSVNLGGAGGFAFAILNGLASGAEWIWLMDDDGRPYQTDTLQRLLVEAKRGDLDAVAPIVLDPNDITKFAFPYRINNKYIFDRDQLPADAFIPSTAHLFNGLLIRSTALFTIGLPDIRLFIRGDEVDFLYRMRRGKLCFGTVASAMFTHPSSNDELHPILGGRLHIVYPEPLWKRRVQYRNRAYYLTRHRSILIFAIDLVRYPYFFIVKRRLDFAGLKDWLRCTWAGFLGRVEAASIVAGTQRKMTSRLGRGATEKELVP
jgi:rhamnopyranosyl-N-acetylglucosaminyl-diphospho-decaprenol beta-1,3/1,4-galactofuranosyltransferase